MADSEVDPTDKIYEAQFAESPDRLEAYADFVAIVKQLRRDCPWDREQTHESVKHLLIEEAYEVVDAIDRADWDELAEELGDVFLHVLFHSIIGEEERHFTLADVLAAETDKLVRRHPHVFGDDSAEDPDAVADSWEEIKQQEKDDEEETSVLDGVPTQLPALLRAYRSQEKAAGVGFEFPDHRGVPQFVEDVEVVVRGRAVGADPDGHARLEHRLHGGDPAGEFHVRGRTVGDADAPLGEQFDLGLVDVDAVGDEITGSEHPEVVGVFERSDTVLFEDRLDFVGGLVGVVM